MKNCIIMLATLSLIGCSYLDSAQQYIEKIKALEANNKQLQSNVDNLIKNLNDANKSLASIQSEADELRKKNAALEKMSEERIRKFWSMYETDA